MLSVLTLRHCIVSHCPLCRKVTEWTSSPGATHFRNVKAPDPLDLGWFLSTQGLSPSHPDNKQGHLQWNL